MKQKDKNILAALVRYWGFAMLFWIILLALLIINK